MAPAVDPPAWQVRPRAGMVVAGKTMPLLVQIWDCDRIVVDKMVIMDRNVVVWHKVVVHKGCRAKRMAVERKVNPNRMAQMVPVQRELVGKDQSNLSRKCCVYDGCACKQYQR